MADPFEGPKLILREGVNQHISKFEAVERQFFNSKPHNRVADIEPETGDLIHKFRFHKMPPAAVRYTAYAAVNDLRNALDQGVVSAAQLLTEPKKAIEHAHFPFAESPNDLNGMLTTKWQYADIPASLHSFLKSFEPYPTSDAYSGGNDILRALGKIANPNKHQIPITIHLKDTGGYTAKAVTITGAADFYNPTWNAAKNEMSFARSPKDTKIEGDFDVPFYISFGEQAGFLTGYPVAGTLRHLLTVANSIILGLERETARLLGN